MNLLKRIVCENCSGEFDIETEDDFLIQYCPGCGTALDEIELVDHDTENHDDE